MAVSMAAVMRQIRNYFERGYRAGTFSITDGVLTPTPSCRYVYIQGSASHDGVWSLADGALQDVPDGIPNEAFTGRVYALHPPNDFIALCREISDYDSKNPIGALQSESFSDYSYTRAGGGSAGTQGWQADFASRLAPYRRMYTEVGG